MRVVAAIIVAGMARTGCRRRIGVFLWQKLLEALFD
jgi:hypothetical protein